MITEADLNQFSGTNEWFRHWSQSLVFTEGVKYLADKAGAYWLIDAIASHQPTARKNEMLRGIQFWRLSVNDSKAVLTCVEDSDRKPVITQNIEFTDFPLKEVEIWVVHGGFGDGEVGYVAMLPGEY